jgi:putative methylase
MGEPAQRRLIRKLDLERFIGQVKPNASPKVQVAATMLYLAYTRGDIAGKRVLDLGCGTGRLGLAAAFLGAKEVVGIDVDRTAIAIAKENTAKAELSDCVSWVTGDIDAIAGQFDTVLQNPPFGVQKRGADRRFVEKALQSGNAVYSLHNHPEFDRQLMSRLKSGAGQLLQVEGDGFLKRLVEGCSGKVEAVYALPLVIPHMFDFHTKTKQEIIIDLYVIRKA